MNNDEMFAAITAQRIALADQLEALAPADWDAPTLCGEWRVREVLGHLVSILDLPKWKFMVGGIGIAGFDRQTVKFATEYGRREPAALLARYRELSPTKFAMPIIGPTAPLVDVVVHSRDIGRPLGLPEVHAPATAQVALTALSGGLPAMSRSSRAKGLHLQATDLDWSHGSGAQVRGTSGDLALALCGRSVACDGLEGEGVSTLRSRLV